LFAHRRKTSVYVKHNSVTLPFTTSDSWTILSPIEQGIKRKIEAVGIPLREWDIRINYGIKTGCNEAFIIDGAKRAELIAADPRSAEIIRPILRGRDIKRYGYEFADQYLIASHNGYCDDNGNEISPIEINEYSTIKAHLDEYWDVISVRTDKGVTPYNLRNCAYMEDFSKQKIIWGNLALSASFSLATEAFYINPPSCMIVPAEKCLLAIMNSRLADFYIRRLGVTRNGGYFEYKPMFVQEFPAFKAIGEKKQELETLVDMAITTGNRLISHQYEDSIDTIVFSIYGLTTAEIEFILNT
jgi:hypothetical protein